MSVGLARAASVRVRPVPSLALIGYGALGQWIAAAVSTAQLAHLQSVVVRPEHVRETRRGLAGVDVVSDVQSLANLPEFALEVASPAAVASFAGDFLKNGVDIAIASTAALADQTILDRLLQNAQLGRARLRMLSGAIGGLDLLAAHREAGLDRVRYTGRKPPCAWKMAPGSPAAPLDHCSTIFRGNARNAALLFPANANVAATIALTGCGLDETEVELISDPTTANNIHLVEAKSAAGSFRLELSGIPLVNNMSTSAIAGWSAVRALDDLTRALIF